MSNQFQNGNFIEVLNALKGNIMRNIHVATIGKYVGLDKDGKFIVEDLNTKEKITCFGRMLDGYQLTTGKIVLVLFTDSEMYNNYLRVKNGGESVEEENNEKHSLNYAIIVGQIITTENE